MLSIPLPFIAGLVFVLTLYPSLKGMDVPLARRYFTAFLVLYAAQALIISLRFGYGVDGLAPVQPVSAACMPVLAYLAFRSMADEPPKSPWLHLAGPLGVAIAVAFMRGAVDILLFALFCGYGVALWRFTRLGGEPAAEAALLRASRTLKAARLTAVLMMFFGVTDGLLFLFAMAEGPDFVPHGVSLINGAVIAIVLACYFWPETVPVRPAETPPTVSEADAALVRRISAALDEDGLFREENLSLARLARKAGLTARDVSGAINRATGLNVSQFVNNRRIAEACHLLEATQRSLTNVMYDSGFSTKSNFNREFRRVTGTNPSSFRALRGTPG